MKRIGLLSDTHGYWDEKFLFYFNECDEVWHAGDIGSEDIADRFEAFKPFRVVYGNIDSQILRRRYPAVLDFTMENAWILMTHIGGYPGRYAKEIKPALYRVRPQLFISGHSHIFKVQYDRALNLLYINPGAAGKYGMHSQRTLVRFTIDNGNFSDLEVIELS